MYIHFLNFQKKHHTISSKGHYLFLNQALLRSEKTNKSHLLGPPEPPMCKSHTTKKEEFKGIKRKSAPQSLAEHFSEVRSGIEPL